MFSGGNRQVVCASNLRGYEKIETHVDDFVQITKNPPRLAFRIMKVGHWIAGFSIAKRVTLTAAIANEGLCNLGIPSEFQKIIKS